MFYSMIIQILLAVFIWLIARYKYKDKSSTKKLKIVRQMVYNYDKQTDDEYNRKKKNKKVKKKTKKLTSF